MSVVSTMHDYVIQQLIELATKYRVKKVILFGSRARGDHSPVSDYDFAIYEDGLSDITKACLCGDVEDIETLKKIDIVFVNGITPRELLKNILQEGVVIYE